MASTRQSPAAAKPISPLYTNSSQQIQAPRNMLQPQNPRVRANRMPLQRKDDSRPFLLKSCFSHLAVAKHTTHVFPPLNAQFTYGFEGMRGFYVAIQDL